MGWIGAAIGAGASIVGDLMSQSGQKSTNAANMAMQQQMEGWQERMSDTAMQRRVQDLRAAGLNPLLAVGQQGATTPGISPVSIQNPNASFAGLGNQVSSALQLQSQSAQIEALQAQAKNSAASARNTDANTDEKLPAEIENIKAQTAVSTEQAKVVRNNIEYVASQIANVREDTALKNVTMLLKEQDYQVLVATKQMLIRQQEAITSSATSASRMAGAQSDVLGGTFGRVMTVLESLIGAATGATAIGAGIRGIGQIGKSKTTQTSSYDSQGVYTGGSTTTTGPQ